MNDTDITGSELLVQRFLDHDLTPAERVQFLGRLGRDAALRDRLIEMEQLLLEVGRLPRPAVPDRFVADVRARIATPAPRPWQRLTRLLWAPLPLQWNLATAAGVCVVLLVAGFMGRGLIDREAPMPADTTAAQTAESPAPVLVRLVLVQPGATTVAAAGDFNGWNPERTPLDPVGEGAWSVTIPLEPGRYEYMFVIDGQQWITDPFAVEQADDGFGSRNAVLDVRLGSAI